MSVKWVQNLYDWMKNAKAPGWLKYLLDTVVTPVLVAIGEEFIEDMRKLIIYAAKQDWTNERKFKYVYDGMRNYGCSVKDYILNSAIEIVYSEMKKLGFV